MPAAKNVKLELVSFDLDGTIVRGHTLDYANIPEKLHRKITEYDELFFGGRLEYEEMLQVELSLFRGMKVDGIAPKVENLPLVRDLHTTIQRLRNAGTRALILTDNPSFAAEPLRKFGFQDIIASEVETLNGAFTGRMRLLTNKLIGLREYCKRQGIELTSCAHVGDWKNDIVVFRAVGLSVAFNPSETSVSKAATYTVKSDSLLDVYRVLEPNLPTS
jgi:phosphoserine phosphatase